MMTLVLLLTGAVETAARTGAVKLQTAENQGRDTVKIKLMG